MGAALRLPAYEYVTLTLALHGECLRCDATVGFESGEVDAVREPAGLHLRHVDARAPLALSEDGDGAAEHVVERDADGASSVKRNVAAPLDGFGYGASSANVGAEPSLSADTTVAAVSITKSPSPSVETSVRPLGR